MQFCNNCQKQLPEDKFDLHLGYCRRNIKRCVDCNRPYDINDADQHEEEFHNFQQCQYCKQKIGAQFLDQHKKSCKLKPIQCTYCEMTVPTDKYDQHREQCEARTKTCEKCQRPVVNKQYFNHLTACSGPTRVQSSSSNSYYSSSQPRSYSMGTTNSSNFQSNSQPTSYYTTNYTNYTTATNATLGSPPVIRTYTRTYVQNPGASSSDSSGSLNTNPVYSTESNIPNNYSSPSEGRIISRRVISTRVITPDQINNPNSEQSNSASTTHTYYTSPNNTTTRTYVSPAATTSYRSVSNAEYQGSHSSSYDEDPELQAALLASLGYNEINSAVLYETVQNQHRLQKQFRK